MTEKNQVYRCSICGNIVEVLYSGGGQLVCCNQPMELLKEKSEDIGMEKHVPVIEKTEKGFKVKVGSIAHPMEEKHYIQFIELIVDENVYRKDLKPGENPEAEFCVEFDEDAIISAREYCNIHGLWKTK